MVQGAIQSASPVDFAGTPWLQLVPKPVAAGSLRLTVAAFPQLKGVARAVVRGGGWTTTLPAANGSPGCGPFDNTQGELSAEFAALAAKPSPDNMTHKLQSLARPDGRGRVIRTLDPRFPKPVLYQAELYPELSPIRYRVFAERASWCGAVKAGLTRLVQSQHEVHMSDLSHPWPRLLNRRTAWMVAAAFIVLLVAVSFFDASTSRWAQALPDPVRRVFAYITGYGVSDWILYPSLIAWLICAGLARIMPKLTPRVALKQMAALFGFILLGVGLPGLLSNLMKRAIGRGRPRLLDEVGSLDFRNVFNDFTYQSFPSGHTTTAFAFALVIGFVSPRLLPWMLAFATAIGLSRVVEGAHYPTDVLGGVVVGTLGAYAVRYFFARRGWVFEVTPAGEIRQRALWAVRRLIKGGGKVRP